ncbi:MAG: hypothetical protein J6B47_03770, partial [Prevotella sp.]|nr:hypothetical protein [Prevotella sp.]
MNRRIQILALAVLMATGAAQAAKKKTAVPPVAVTHLTTERMNAPMSIATATPRLGWRISSTKNDVMQTEYHIIVASTKEKAEKCEGDLWDATVKSSQSQWISYGGKAVRSN